MLVLEQSLLVLETVRDLMLVLEQILIMLDPCSSSKSSARALLELEDMRQKNNKEQRNVTERKCEKYNKSDIYRRINKTN